MGLEGQKELDRIEGMGAGLKLGRVVTKRKKGTEDDGVRKQPLWAVKCL